MSLSNKSIHEVRGWQIRVVYRLTYFMAWITGDLDSHSPLTSVLQQGDAPRPLVGDTTRMPGTQSMFSLLKRMEEDRTTMYTLDYGEGPQPPGYTLLPPPLPDDAYQTPNQFIPVLRRNGVEPEIYVPEYDMPFRYWLRAYELLADYLGAWEGTIHEPEAGIYGLTGLFEPKAARFMWPSMDELLQYEQELMLMVFDLLCDRSGQGTEEWIMEHMGYSRIEAVVLAKTALRYGVAVYGDDFDLGKVRELKALDIIADSAKESLDVRAQLAARKQSQLLAGYTRLSASNEQEAFNDMARKTLEEEILEDL